MRTWSGIFVSPLGKRYAHGILDLLAMVAEHRCLGTKAELETTLLDQAERLKQQLLGLATGVG